MKVLHFILALILVTSISINEAFGQIKSAKKVTQTQTVTQGEFLYRDGSVYKGDLYKGIPYGEGEVNYASGNYYIGGWQKHAPHGEGTMYWPARDGKIHAIWEYGKIVRKFPEKKNIEQVTDMVPFNDPKRDFKIWAIVIGISHYNHMPSLQFADDDAYQVHSFLKSPAGGALPNEQIRLLIDESATKDNILEAMKSISKLVGKDDVIFFYYSGHGLQNAFLPSDYNGAGRKLFHKEITTLMNITRAKHKFLIVDACHSEAMFRSKSGEVSALSDKFYSAFENANGGTILLSSSKVEEYSLEDKGLRSGVFSYFLREGLDGKADANGDKIVTISELYEFIYTKVRKYTRNAQTPILKGAFDRNTPVSVVR